MKLIIDFDKHYGSYCLLEVKITEEDAKILTEMIQVFEFQRKIPLSKSEDPDHAMPVNFKIEDRTLLLFTHVKPPHKTPAELKDLFLKAKDLLWKELDNYKLFAKLNDIHIKLKGENDGTSTDSKTDPE